MKKTLSQVFFLTISIPLAACTVNYKIGTPIPAVNYYDIEKPTPETKVKYSVDFLSDGNVVVKTSKGVIVKKRRKLDLPQNPLPVKAIVNHHSIIEAQGSCLVIIDGYLYPC